jgi:hypothetical protein
MPLARKLQPGCDAELLEDRVQLVFDGWQRDPQMLGDFRVGHALFANQAHEDEFTGSQSCVCPIVHLAFLLELIFLTNPAPKVVALVFGVPAPST